MKASFNCAMNIGKITFTTLDQVTWRSNPHHSHEEHDLEKRHFTKKIRLWEVRGLRSLINSAADSIRFNKRMELQAQVAKNTQT